jgi:hypothetical protein
LVEGLAEVDEDVTIVVVKVKPNYTDKLPKFQKVE